MENFREKLNSLRAGLERRFWELREQNPEIIFLTKEEVDHWEIDDYFDRRDDNSGAVQEITVTKIDKEGIHTIDTEDSRLRKVIGLRDLASIEDVISLVELMEIKCRKK